MTEHNTHHQNQPQITVRPAVNGDFDALAGIFDAIWGWEIKGNSGERDFVAQFYASEALYSSDFIRVAVCEGRPVGLMCARIGIPAEDDLDRAALLRVTQMCEAGLAATPEGREALDFYKGIDDVNERLNEKRYGSRTAEPVEMKLLIADPRVPHRGIGRPLVDALFAKLAECRRDTCMLHTDSHCNWQYYEKNGWTRTAEIPWEFEPAGEEGKIDAYIYERPVKSA